MSVNLPNPRFLCNHILYTDSGHVLKVVFATDSGGDDEPVVAEDIGVGWSQIYTYYNYGLNLYIFPINIIIL